MRLALGSDRGVDSPQSRGRRALDVVVEAEVMVPVPVRRNEARRKGKEREREGEREREREEAVEVKNRARLRTEQDQNKTFSFLPPSIFFLFLSLAYLSRMALARSELKSSNWITQFGHRDARLRITSSMIAKKSSPTIRRRLRPK